MSGRDGEIDLGDIVRSLAETIVWCEAHADLTEPETSLRSAELNPYPAYHKRKFEYADDDLSKRPSETVSKVVLARRKLLGAMTTQRHELLGGGRLLSYEPDWTLWSGATEVYTEGFFNAFDAPPWDTWVAWMPEAWTVGDHHHVGYLVSWIPQVFLETAAKGTWANDSGSLWWLDESDRELAHLLAR